MASQLRMLKNCGLLSCSNSLLVKNIFSFKFAGFPVVAADFHSFADGGFCPTFLISFVDGFSYILLQARIVHYFLNLYSTSNQFSNIKRQSKIYRRNSTLSKSGKNMLKDFKEDYAPGYYLNYCSDIIFFRNHALSRKC